MTIVKRIKLKQESQTNFNIIETAVSLLVETDDSPISYGAKIGQLSNKIIRHRRNASAIKIFKIQMILPKSNQLNLLENEFLCSQFAFHFPIYFQESL